MAEKIIKIDGKEVRIKATASTPRRYRDLFHRDMIMDMEHLVKVVKKGKNKIGLSSIAPEDLELFENVAFTMVKQADPENKAKTPDEWMDTFDGVLSIYEAMPQIMELWVQNNKSLVTAKKK